MDSYILYPSARVTVTAVTSAQGIRIFFFSLEKKIVSIYFANLISCCVRKLFSRKATVSQLFNSLLCRVKKIRLLKHSFVSSSPAPCTCDVRKIVRYLHGMYLPSSTGRIRNVCVRIIGALYEYDSNKNDLFFSVGDDSAYDYSILVVEWYGKGDKINRIKGTLKSR